MGCKLGLELNELKKLEKSAVPEHSVSRDHYVSFFKSAGSKRIPESGTIVLVYKPDKKRFESLINTYLEKDESASELWQINLNAGTEYLCIGCVDSPIFDRLAIGEIPKGSCNGCAYNE